MIQGCFSNPGSPVSNRSKNVQAATTSSSKESLITCIYQTRLIDSPIYLTLTWSRTPYSHSLTIHAPDLFSITISLQPSTFSIFRTRPGSKSIQLNQTPDHHNQNESQPKIKLYYDFTRAEFAQPNSAEPESRFYLAFIRNGRVEFLLGDLQEDLTRRVGLGRVVDNSAESTLLSRREHVFGRRIYATRSEFLGSTRSIEIECSGGTLKVKFDGELKVNVKRLAWKFRGNERMMIDGIAVEFYWDVLNWVNNNNNNHNNGGNLMGAQKNGVFVFQVGEGGVWPEMVGPEKRLMRKNSPAPGTALSPAGSCSSVLQWAEESSDCGRSSSGSSSTTRSSGSFGGGGGGGNGGYSLVLYAWRRD